MSLLDEVGTARPKFQVGSEGNPALLLLDGR
jgi:hypothetical protein